MQNLESRVERVEAHLATNASTNAKFAPVSMTPEVSSTSGVAAPTLSAIVMERLMTWLRSQVSTPDAPPATSASTPVSPTTVSSTNVLPLDATVAGSSTNVSSLGVSAVQASSTNVPSLGVSAVQASSTNVSSLGATPPIASSTKTTDVSAKVSPDSGVSVPPLPAPPASSGPKTVSLGDWENLIGGKWALWVGSLCLFLALASFLVYSARFLPPPPPWAKVAMGFGAGVALLGLSEWNRARAQRWFSEGLAGAGLSLGYLSLWAGAQFFGIIPSGLAFGAMALWTALGVALAVRADARGLSVLSTLGAFLTPVLLRDGAGNSSLALLIYLVVVNGGIVGVSLWKRWSSVTWLAWGATVLLLGAWSFEAPFALFRWPIFGLWSVLWAMFVAAACFGSLARREQTAPADLGLLWGATATYAPASFVLLKPALGDFPGVWALGMSLVFGLLCVSVGTISPRNRALRQSCGALSLGALTLTFPLQLGGSSLCLAWASLATALVLVGRRAPSSMLRVGGQCVWIMAALVLGLETFDADKKLWLVFSRDAFSWAWMLAATAILAFDARRNDQSRDEQLAPFYTPFVTFGGAWLLAQEIARALQRAAWPSATHYEAVAAWIIAGVVAFYAVAVFLVGRRLNDATVRWSAWTLALGAAVLPLWASFALASAPWTPLNFRIFSFLAVGVALWVLGMCARRTRLEDGETHILRAWPLLLHAFVLAAISCEVWFALGANLARSATGLPPAMWALSALWSVFAALVIGHGARMNDAPLRVLGWWIGGAALFALGVHSLAWNEPGALPFFNARFAAFAMALGALLGTLQVLRRYRETLSETEQSAGAVLVLVALGILGWALTQETSLAVHARRAHGGVSGERTAQMAISLVWSLYGALMLLGGIARRHQTVRLAALGLLAATVVKVFVFDLSFLDGPLRMLSLGGLGLALVFISWLYGRFGKNQETNESLR